MWRLAIADDAEAQYRLGQLVAQPPSGAQADSRAAAYWYERAADQGHAAAARRLGDLYAAGLVGAFQSMGQMAPRLGEAVRWYETAAAKGDAAAKGALDGLATRSPLAAALISRAAGDAATARRELEALAARHDLEALYWRGVMEETGEGGPADPAGAIRWYQGAYQLGFGEAALALGELYETGRGGRRDIDQAYRMYSAAQARGAAGAAAGLGRLDLARRSKAPLEGLSGALTAYEAREYATAADWLRPLAVGGDADAQYWLATLYVQTREPAREEAIRWFRAAALQGDAESAYQLAQLLAPDRAIDAEGRSLGDAALQAHWLQIAAEAGHHDAAMALADAYRGGRGVAPDPTAVDRWSQRAHRAEAGQEKLSRPLCVEDDSVPDLLPVFLACNRGDDQGVVSAVVGLAKAGNARAEAWLGYLLEAGAGSGGTFDLEVRPNAQRAARWYAKAARQGLPSAMYDYGAILDYGIGVPVDGAAAKGWYAKAAEAGFPGAKEALAAVGGSQP